MLLLPVALFVALGATAQDPDQKVLDAIKAHRKTLLGPDPKPAGHADRRDAIAALVQMDAGAAHDLLRELLAAFGDAGKSPYVTVRSVLARLAEQEAIDLVPDKLVEIDKDKRLQRRLAIYTSYVAPLVRLWSAVDARVKEPAKRTALREEIQRYFTKLPGEVRRPELEKLVTGAAVALRVAAVQVAGRTKDPLMAPKLAPLLADPSLRDAVRDALFDLTLEAETFADRAEFDAWWKLNRGKTYQELAVAAARKARDLAKRLEHRHAEDAARLRARLFESARRVLALGLARLPPPWKQLRLELQDPELRPYRARLLDDVYAALRAAKIDRKALQRTQGDLVALCDWLDAAFDKAAPQDRQSVLSAHAVCATLLGGKTAEAAKTRLLDLLGRAGGAQSEIRIDRVFDLVTLFPEDAVRRRVLEVLRRPQTAPHLTAGLGCLRSLGLASDKRLAGQTLTWLEKQVLDDGLDTGVRELALEILGGIGIHDVGVLASLRALVQRTAPKTLPENLRATALQWAILGSDAQLQARTNGDLEAQADAQLAFLETCIADQSARIRLDAAKVLEGFPRAKANFSKPFLRKTAQAIVAGAGTALRRERRPGCVRQLRAVLLAQAASAGIHQAALTQLAMAARQWAQDIGTGTDGGATFLETQLPGLRQDLARLLAGRNDIQPLATLELARALLDAALPLCAHTLLASPVLARLDAPAPTTDPDAARKQAEERKTRTALVVEVAAAAGSYDHLDPTARKRVDALLVSAANGIRATPSDHPLALPALGRALLATGKTAQAATVLALFLDAHAGAAPPAVRARAELLLARAWIATGKPADAAKLLATHTDLDSRLLHAHALLQSSAFAAAEQAYHGLLDDPALPKTGGQRALVRLGQVEALLAQNKLDTAAKLLAALPTLQDQAAKAKLELLRAQLQERRAAKKPGGEKKGSPAGGPGKDG